MALAWLSLYVVGVVCGVVQSDAPPLTRLGLALLWPLGPLAFVVTVAVLLLASAIAYPLVMGPALLAGGAMAWALLR